MSRQTIGPEARIEQIEARLAELPVGSVTYKTIKGKLQPYLQWTENGKTRSRYIKVADRELVIRQAKERKALRQELEALRRQSTAFPKSSSEPALAYETNVIVGEALAAFCAPVAGWQRRQCYSTLHAYAYGPEADRVCLLYGLRRTGKTTLIRQLIGSMDPTTFTKAAYVKARPTDDTGMFSRDLERMWERGIRYVFIDEATLMEDFIDSAALFSDVFATRGMKVVLSGTDSLGFWFAQHDELYDRAVCVHTTFIPFREHARLLGISDIDEYIRYGGTLRAGELAFDEPQVDIRNASFRDDESTRRYIDTAICENIQHSLACCKAGRHFRHLQELYESDELTSAINRIIEDMNHSFLVRTLVSRFKSHDLGSAAEVMRKERDPDRRTDILDRIDRASISDALRRVLEIRNKEEQAVEILPAHVFEIREYLEALELVRDCPIETMVPGAEALHYAIITQPGMRYCQAQALVHVLMRDEAFASFSEREKRLATQRILEEVRGRMLEDIVLLETMAVAGDHQRVFKLLFAAGEYDMAIYDEIADSCELYEVKHSATPTQHQRRFLENEQMIAQVERRFGQVTRRVVLYRGKNDVLPNGIEYQNVEEYLLALS